MAWRNILINISFPTVAQITVTDFSLLELTSYPSDLSSYISQPIADKNDFNVGNAWAVVMGESPNYIGAIKQSAASCTVRLYMNGFRNPYSYGNDFISTGYTWGYIACVDDENQKGFFALVMKSNTSTATPHFWAGNQPPYPNAKESATQLYYRDGMYTLLTGNEYHQYTWSSVPAISGKNGILSLSTLVDINDGNPVETTDITKFTLTSASNVKTLVDAVPLGSIPASGGGASGSNPQYGGQTITGKSGTQVSGYAFGQGGASGGGGGFYGGYGAEDDVSPAGAGSGYIGNPLLSNKKMYGYGVSKVTTEDAYTVSKTDHSSAAIEKKPKAGNGHARITYLRPSENPTPVWDGHFFNADFSSDGKDSVRYDSSRTVVFPLDNSDMEPHTAIQGTMFEGFDETGWSISNGILDTGNVAYDGKRFIWLYDYEHIDNKILPRSCTFYIDMDFWIYDDDYRSMHLSFHSPYTYYDRYGYLNLIEYMTFGLSFSDYYTPYITTQILDSTGEGYNLDYDIGSSPLPITYQTWHNLKAKVEILSSRVSKITLYFDNVEFASKEFDAATEQVPFVCINDNDTRPAWFCMLSGDGFKTRKVFVGRSVT